MILCYYCLIKTKFWINIHKKINYLQKIYIAIEIILGLLVISIFFYHHVEGWSYINSFYFSVITLTTIGFGDLVPTTAASKIFTSFLALFGVGSFLFALSVISEHYFYRRISDNKYRTIFKKIIKKEIKNVSEIKDLKYFKINKKRKKK